MCWEGERPITVSVRNQNNSHLFQNSVTVFLWHVFMHSFYQNFSHLKFRNGLIKLFYVFPR